MDDSQVATAAASPLTSAANAQKSRVLAQKPGDASSPTVDPTKRPINPTGRLGVAVYNIFYAVASVLMGMFFPTRVAGANCVPKSGGFLLVANHESYLDPPLLGLTCYRRQLHYLAMSGLFKFAPFRWLILSLGAVKIEREGNATAGIKASLAVVNSGHGLVVFPEGGRTPNGELQELKSGVLLLLKRSKAPIVVAGVAGAYHSWPLFRLLPIPRPLWVQYETWTWPEGADDRTALADLSQRLQQAVTTAQRGWRRIGGRRIHRAPPQP